MRGLLSVCFGTSHADTRERTIDAIEASLQREFPDRAFYSAWTSSRIVAKTRERGELHDTLDEAFSRLDADGVNDLVVSTMCLMPGKEMAMIARGVEVWANSHGHSAYLADPLLATEGDRRAVARIVRDEFSFVGDDDALLLMGHGCADVDSDVFSNLQSELHAQGRRRFFVATVEGAPSFEDALPLIDACGAQRVYVAPLMIVAGDHAKNDMAGAGEDSWASRLRASGKQVEVVMKGLGEYEGIHQLVCDHVREALMIREVALRG